MRRFRRGFRRGTSRPVRNKEWIGFTTSNGGGYYEPDEILLLPGDELKAWIITPEEARTEWDEPTIVRLLLGGQIYQAGSPARFATDYRTTIRGGFCTWKSTVKGAPSVTSLDDLDGGDPGIDWLWWGEWHFQHTALNAIATQFTEFPGADHGKMDIRTKRKLELGYGLAGAFISEPHGFPFPPATPTGGANVFFNGRILLLNH